MIINMYVIFNKRTMHTNNFYTYISPYDVLCCVICARLMCCMYKQLATKRHAVRMHLQGN